MRTLALRIVAAGVAAGLLTLGGCGPNPTAVATYKALIARVDPAPTYNESARFVQTTYLTPHDRDYVMWSMDYASLCLMGGNYDAAKAELLRCYDDIQTRQDVEKERAAALSNEAMKVFKGEPFERATVCTYLGILHYMDGDYNNARIFCARADMEDATTEDDMAAFRHDFGLAHYWLGRAYLKLGQQDNARIAFTKACEHLTRKDEEAETAAIRKSQTADRTQRIRLEKQSYQLATTGKVPVAGAADMSNCMPAAELPAEWPGSALGDDPVLKAAESPEQFFTVGYQSDVNLIVLIETGIGPIKYLIGENGYMDAIMRAPYAERRTVVYLNGHKAGAAVQLVDLFHQADTRGTSEKDRVQMTKGVTQSILSRMPYVGDIASHWDVRADWRYWQLMPGEMHLFAAKVKPGLYTLNVQCLDANDCLLPRYRLTRYFIPVTDDAESIVWIHTKPEADNTYAPPPK
jgi:tetratricopeptide (TPR) repeat protein